MNHTKIILHLGIFFSFFLTLSCATNPTKLSTEFTNRINKISLAVEYKSDKFEVIDHTKVWNTQLTHGQYGAVGGLLEGIILQTTANIRINKSLGGDPDILINSIGNIKVDEIIYNDIKNRLTKRYEVIDARNLRLKNNHNDSTTPSDVEKVTTILDQYDLTGINTFVKVKFIYGLSAYIGESASTDIDADIEIWDVSKKKSLIKLGLMSDLLFKNEHTIGEFSNNDASLFKENISKSAESVALQIAAIFGIDVEERDSKVIIDTQDSTYMTCNQPNKFSQDCSSFSGAKRKIELQNRQMMISGSADGKLILVMDDKIISSSFKRAFSLGISDAGTDEAIECGRIVESFFTNQNIKIKNKIKLVEMGAIVGFIIELEEDGYSLLKKYTIDNNDKQTK